MRYFGGCLGVLFFLSFVGYILFEGTILDHSIVVTIERQLCTPKTCFIVLDGWLKRADTPHPGETDVRYAAGFLVAPAGKHIRVIKAPDGYSDTIGRLFYRPKKRSPYTARQIELLKDSSQCVSSGKRNTPGHIYLDDCRSAWDFVLEYRREWPKRVAKANKKLGVTGYRGVRGFSCGNCWD